MSKRGAIGASAITTGGSMTWITGKVKRTLPSPSGKGIFLLCSLRTTDEYWINKMLDAYKGKFPSKIRYRNGSLKYRKNNTIESIFLSKDPDVALKEIKRFYYEHGVQPSRKDIDADEEVRNRATSKVTNINRWRDANKTKLQDRLIYDYATREQKEMGITDLQAQNLVDMIKMGMDISCIGDNDIVIHDDRIHNIRGIEFNGRWFEIERRRIDSIKRKNNVNQTRTREYYFEKPYISQSLNTFIDLDKKWDKRKVKYRKMHELSDKRLREKSERKKQRRRKELEQMGVTVPERACTLIIS